VYEILRDRDLEPLAEGVLEVLEKVGMSCQSTEIVRALEQRGARVDRAGGSIRFPRAMVADFVGKLRAEDKHRWAGELKGENRETLYSGYVPPVERANEFRAPDLPYVFHPLAPFIYDDEKRRKRDATREDMVLVTKMADALHPELGVGHSLILSDVPAAIEPLEAALALLEYAHKPRGVYVQDVRQMDYLREMEAIAGIQDPCWRWLANVSFASPLKLGKEIGDRFVGMVKSGDYPAKVYTMAVSGVNAPVTVAGCVVLQSAEFLALWLAARALRHDVPLTAMALTGVMGMRGGDVNYWAFDALMRRLATCEFIRKWTGVCISPGVGEYSPARLPGFYSALEKAYVAMTIAAFTGHHPQLGIGHLESGLVFSPAQFLLDRDFAGGLKFLERPEISPASIGLETILDVGFGTDRTYLESEHTLKRFRSCLWDPAFLDLAGWTPESEAKALAKAQAKVKELVSAYQKPPVDPDKLAKMRQVVDRAKKELL